MPIKWTIAKHYLKQDGILTKAVVIDDSVYHGNRRAGSYVHLYRFTVKGKYYTEVVDDMNNYQTGDTVCIRYWPDFPSMSITNAQCVAWGWDAKQCLACSVN
ncbi:MAG TPA: hypothetical protein VK559_00560 [Ferruginibacter sp.]|nr:hypothetical protein [Ferruginibacter sp.]